MAKRRPITTDEGYDRLVGRVVSADTRPGRAAGPSQARFEPAADTRRAEAEVPLGPNGLLLYEADLAFLAKVRAGRAATRGGGG